jgi:hypothetical protein
MYTPLSDEMIQVGKILLIQAKIPPYNEGQGELGDQYGIESVELTVDGIRIVNHGVEHYLEVKKVSQTLYAAIESFRSYLKSTLVANPDRGDVQKVYGEVLAELNYRLGELLTLERLKNV